MAKSSNQKLKLLYLMRIFEENTDDDHALTMAQIIAKLSEYGIQAERKSLYADIEELRTFGLDIEKRKSKIYEYYIANRAFELPELKLLVDAVQSSKFITHKKSNQLIKKVESLVSVYQAQQLQRQVYVTNRTKTMNEGIYYNVDKIQSGILENKQITFQYFEWAVSFGTNEKVVKRVKKNGDLYVVSPWALTWDDENYYMIGYDVQNDKVKHYRVDKMISISLTDEPRLGQENFQQFDIGNYAKKIFGMFGGQEETIRLQVNKRLVGVVVDRFGTQINIEPKNEDSFIVTIDVLVSPQFFAWLFGLGEDVIMLSPDTVIKQYKKQIKKISKQYKQI
ncbi:MAG TPA: WYL domain-containing protein [Clostridiales bacterium]|nr:WYL domain-containing protein [Clostridiales bacterium]